MSPRISVIIPAYNRFSMLVLVVESILGQTVPVQEVVVVDDGSQDETAEAFPRALRERPGWRQRVRYLRQENQGQSAALNRGIAASRSEWLGFCAHDDLWLPWKLEWQLRALTQCGPAYGLCFTDAWFMNNPFMKQTVFQFVSSPLRTSPIGAVENPLELVTRPHPVWVQTCLARRDLASRAGNFDPFLRYSEDHDFLFRIAQVTRFCYVNLPLVLIDRSPATLRHTGAGEDWHKVEYCLRMDQYRYEKQLRGQASLPPAVRQRVRCSLRSLHSHWATYYLQQGDFAQARAHLGTACGYHAHPKTVLKRWMVACAPRLARSVFVARDRASGPRHDRSSWQTSSPSAE